MLKENNLEMLLFRSRYLKQKNYWTRKLSGQMETTDILTASKKYRGDTFEIGDNSASVNRGHDEIPFDDELSRRILNMCKHSELSLYIFLLSALKALIHRYTNHKDIIVFSPIHGGKADEETINSLVLICQHVDGTRTFKELVLSLRKSVLEAYENQDYPYEKLEKFLFPSTSPSHISCWLENFHRKADIEKIKTRLSFCFSTRGEKIQGCVLYDPNFYRQSEIHGLANHFLLLLNRVGENIDTLISNIIFVTEEEKNLLLKEFNNNKVDFYRNKTLPRWIEEQVEKAADAVAIVCNHHQITYIELNQRANRIANLLRIYNLQQDRTVGILFHRSIPMVESILAAWKAGGAYIPLDTDDPVQRLQGILADSAAAVLLGQSQWVTPQLEKTYEGSILRLDPQQKEVHRDKENRGNLNLNTAPGSLAYVIYTSGSTGKPKGAMVEHIGMMNHIHAKIANLQITAKSIVAQNASHTFDISVWQFFAALTTGGKTIVYPNRLVYEPDRFISRVVEDQVTILEVVPSYQVVMLEFLDANFRHFDSLEYLLVTGETIKPALVNQWFDKYPAVKMVNAYGPTEASDDITHYIMDKAPDMERVPIGKPVRNLNIYILDEYMNLCPLGIVGEICVSGIGVGRGYLNNPELTFERFLFVSYKSNKSYMAYISKKIYLTGDLGRWLPDGVIEFFGRKDYQVKIRGVRIELGEIENHLSAYPGIKEVVVIIKTVGRGDGSDQPAASYLCAYLVPAPGKQPDILAIKEYLAKHLPDYMIPDNFVELEHIPLTANGKIDRKVLSRLDDRIPMKKDHVAPRDKVENQLVQVWADVLGIESSLIGIDTSFFELGGNSLRATVLISKLNRVFNVMIPLAELFQTPTVRHLAQYIGGLKENRFASIGVVEEKEYFRLSSAQKRLYVLQQMDQEGIGYNIPHAYELEGELDKNRLGNTFRGLIQRHESLRTSFDIVNGEPIQKIHHKAEFEVEYYDISKIEAEVKVKAYEGTGGLAPLSLEPVTRNPQPATALISSFIRPFDLSNSPLLRVGLIRLHTPPFGHPSQEGNVEDKHILIVDMHHIITDGISISLFIRESMALYAGEELPPLKFQYKDYAQWQNSEPQKKAIKEQEEFWLRQFADEVPVLDMPYDYLRPAIQSFAGAVLSFEVSADLTRSINRMALDTGATLYMVLLAIYNILLSKISGQENIVVGTPIAARRHADLQRIIGMFVNTLAMRNYPGGDKKFIDFLRKLQQRTLEAFENQEYQFEDLVGEIFVNRDTSRNPIFDTMFVLQNMEAQANEIPRVDIYQLTIRPYEIETRVSICDLLLSGFELEGKLHCAFVYCTKLFKKNTIERFVIYFKQILSAVLENRNQKISQIEIITAEEKRQILYNFNDTAAAYDGEKTLHQLFEEQVERTPDNTALTGSKLQNTNYKQNGVMHLSYRKLNEKSHQLAVLLIEKGVKPDTIVGIMLERSLEMVTGILGILKAGGAYLPIDPDYTGERINYMLADSGAKILLSADHHPDLPSSPLPSFSHLHLPPAPATCLAYIIYTSGSTGKPKGVLVEHRSVVNILTALQTLYPLKRFDTYLLKTSYLFDVSVTELFGWFREGGRLALLEKDDEKDPAKIIDIIEREGITHINFVPSMFGIFVDQLYINTGNVKKLSNLKYIFLAGEALLPGLVEKFSQLNTPIPLKNIYGPTEGTIYSSLYSLSIWGGGIVPIGTPMSNIKLYIMDVNNRFQPKGVPGELYISGDGLARGYLNRPGLTADRFDHDFWDYQDDQDEEKKDTIKKYNKKLLRGGPDASRGGFLEKSPPK
ncbi:MAG: amino acid adenylation domain-containing protein, partial [Candidatus Aminicenantes bacterium]